MSDDLLTLKRQACGVVAKETFGKRIDAEERERMTDRVFAELIAMEVLDIFSHVDEVSLSNSGYRELEKFLEIAK